MSCFHDFHDLALVPYTLSYWDTILLDPFSYTLSSTLSVLVRSHFPSRHRRGGVSVYGYGHAAVLWIHVIHEYITCLVRPVPLKLVVSTSIY